VGIDGFKTKKGEKVFLFSESIGNLVSFKDIVAQDESCATGKYIGNLMINALVNGTIDAGGTDADVEDFYAAVVGDNMAANIAGAKKMEERFPHVFFNGCRSHCTDLLCEDICGIAGIKSVIDNAHYIAKFVQRHVAVKAAFIQIMESKKCGHIRRLMPETRFAYADLLCSTVMGGVEEANIAIYMTMIDEPGWETNTAATVNDLSRQKFERIVKSNNFYKKYMFYIS